MTQTNRKSHDGVGITKQTTAVHTPPSCGLLGSVSKFRESIKAVESQADGNTKQALIDE